MRIHSAILNTAATLAATLLAACGPASTPGSDGPSVVSTIPAADAAGIAVHLPLFAKFDRAMDPATLTASTFHLKQGSVDVAASVTYANKTATLTPTAALAPDTSYTATVTTGTHDEAGKALASDHSWTFRTVSNSAPPTVSGTKPVHAAMDVWRGQQPTATFNKPMNASTLTATTFLLQQDMMPVAGRVAYQASTNTATFIPAVPLEGGLIYTAILTTQVTDAMGQALAATYKWSFTTRAAVQAEPGVNLGSAANYVILAKTQISTVPTSAITGDIGVSPAAATFITGFSLTADATTTFATSPQVTGKVYAADYTSPTSSNLTIAVDDMLTAFTDAAGRAPDVTELGAGDIGGLTLAPGVYKWSSGLLIPTDVHLVGSATDVWIFDIAQDLTMAGATNIVLSGGAQAKNVFWQVSGQVDIGTTSHVEGIILSQTAINLQTGASIKGRLLAQSAVSLDSNAVTKP